MSSSKDGKDNIIGILKKYLFPENEFYRVIRDVVVVLLLFSSISASLFFFSGLWPPMVSVVSGSMEPNIHKGDLLLIKSPDKMSQPDEFKNTGVVPLHSAESTERFGNRGSVIVYSSTSSRGGNIQIVHRAMFWVEEGENWYGEANKKYIGEAENCNELPNCPAPDSGFITKGDSNPVYDQVGGIHGPVEPSEIRGVAVFRIPFLGWIKIIFSTIFILSFKRQMT